MRGARRWWSLIVACTVAGFFVHDGLARARAAASMADRANAFLSSLTAEQRVKAAHSFDDKNRFEWYYIPRKREGLSLNDMTEPQRKLAAQFLQSGLSTRGYKKADDIQKHEVILRAVEEGTSSPFIRDPGLYYFTIFGTPSANSPWGWRVDGHHLSLNYTIVSGNTVASSPAFMGANPAEVLNGPQKGLRILASEEDLGRELLLALDQPRRTQATFNVKAPGEIITRNAARVDPLAPAGIAFRALDTDQRAKLRKLVMEYLSAMPDDVAEERRAAIEKAGWDEVSFAWAGESEHLRPHYYRVQGPTFLIEYDNTQDNANHIHSVWRDFAGDFGRDLLGEHYKSQH